MNEPFAALDAERQATFTEDLLQRMEKDNRLVDDTLVLPSAYLEVVIGRR